MLFSLNEGIPHFFLLKVVIGRVLNNPWMAKKTSFVKILKLKLQKISYGIVSEDKKIIMKSEFCLEGVVFLIPYPC